MSQNEDETKMPEETQAAPTETEVGATQADESNPFTSDLKGEFTSSFGTETNTVSQLLSDGAFGSKKNKILMGAGAAIFAAAIGLVVMSGGDDMDSDDSFGNSDDVSLVDDGDDFEESETDLSLDGEETEDLTNLDVEEADLEADSLEAEEEAAAVEAEEQIAEAGAEGEDMIGEDGESLAEQDGMAVEEGAADPAVEGEGDALVTGQDATDAPMNLMPADGSSRSYDETSEYASFSWEGSPGGRILFSRSSTMVPVERKANVSGNEFRLRHPYPGVWYWKVVNGAGESAVQSFVVDGAVRRNIAVNLSPGSSISGNGGQVSWTGDTKVARYKVEVSQSGWANPEYKFQTSGQDVQMQGVQPGAYQLRVGAFSEVSGRWEYSQPVDVTVQ